MSFQRAIVRVPGENFSEGVTTGESGAPEYALALAQHEAYCAALRECGLELTILPADLRYPDSTFVEDVAVLAGNCAVLTHPGAPSRQGEVEAIRSAVSEFFSSLFQINEPGALDGGDVCEADDHFFIGISQRTNEEGARQLAALLKQAGFTSSLVDVRRVPGMLHLKSWLAYLGNRTLVVAEGLASLIDQFPGFRIIRVDRRESYAANCLRINDTVLLPAGYAGFQRALEVLNYPLITLDMSEFEKMNGGLSCLSLRF
ncbi:MAG TPA: arginine deiminase family protein [Anaerolineaceae bacterium]|nr:arginine deiminase family protein [Anaerolineaceae bacterium]